MLPVTFGTIVGEYSSKNDANAQTFEDLKSSSVICLLHNAIISKGIICKLISLGRSISHPSDGVLPAILHLPRTCVFFFPKSYMNSSRSNDLAITLSAVSLVSLPREHCLIKPKTSSNGCDPSRAVDMFPLKYLKTKP